MTQSQPTRSRLLGDAGRSEVGSAPARGTEEKCRTRGRRVPWRWLRSCCQSWRKSTGRRDGPIGSRLLIVHRLVGPERTTALPELKREKIDGGRFKFGCSEIFLRLLTVVFDNELFTWNH